MKINIANYEAYMLDYLEGNILPEDKALLLAFLDQHPELKNNLDVPVNFFLPDIKDKGLFDKTSLKKHPADAFNMTPLDYLYIKEIEEGLSTEELKEQLLLEPDKNERLHEKSLFAKSILKPDLHIQINYKSSLKRASLYTGIHLSHFNQIAAILVVVLMASAILYVPRHIAFQSTTRITQSNNTSSTHNDIIAKAQPKILERKTIYQRPVTKDSLMQIANDPLGNKKQKGSSRQTEQKQTSNTFKVEKINALTDIKLTEAELINGFEYGLNVMMPQYMSNNILRKELADIYQQIEEESEHPRNLAFVENGVKVLNFLSKDAVQLDKYYDDQGNITGYNLIGNHIEIQRRAR